MSLAVHFTNAQLERAENWHHLIFASYGIQEVLIAVKDPAWQAVRISMLGEPLQRKMQILEDWLNTPDEITEEMHGYHKKVQVTNYVHALKRGGLIR